MTLDIIRKKTGEVEISLTSWSAINVLMMISYVQNLSDIFELKAYLWKVRA